MDLEKRKALHLELVNRYVEREVVNLGRFPESDRIVLFDCGARHGVWTEAFFKTYPNAKIEAHLFEPTQRGCDFIREHHDDVFGPCRFGHTIKLNQIAVGEREEVLTLHLDKEGSGWASFVARPDFPPIMTEDVSVKTLDDYAAQANVERIDLLKLDVEGWEWRALKGASRLLAEQRIGSVLFEFSQCNVFTRTFFYDLWTILRPTGFDFFFVDRSQEFRLQPIPQYSGEWERFKGTSMFFARHHSLPVESILVTQPRPQTAAGSPDRAP